MPDTTPRNAPPPNILMIVIDDLNNVVGCMNNPIRAHTPNIDRLAARGTLFRNAHCPAPICVPARTAVLSGIPPTESGCYVNTRVVSDNAGGAMRSPGLAATLPLSRHFGDAGYRTLHCGKTYHGGWHSDDQANRPLWSEANQEEWIQAVMRDNRADPPGVETVADADGNPSFSLRWAETGLPDPGVLGDEITTRWCIEKLGEPPSEKPFLLSAGFVRPHTPLFAPPEFFKLYDPNEIIPPKTDTEAFARLSNFARTIALSSGGYGIPGGIRYHLEREDQARAFVHAYLACTSYVDACIGRLLDALDASHHAENTVIALWADHGWSLGDHHHVQKWALWRSSTNVPLIVARPGGGRGVCDVPVSTLDLYPTLAGLCGLPARPEWKGHSLRPLMDDPATFWPHPAITTYGPGNHAVRTGEGTFIRYADGSEELYTPADRDETRDLGTDPAAAPLKRSLAAQLPTQEVMPLHWNGADPSERMKSMRDGDVVRVGSHLDGISNRALRIRARARIDGGETILLSLHGIYAGVALYVKDRRLCFALRDVLRPIRCDAFTPQRHILRSEALLSAEPADLEAELAADGTAILRVGRETVATATFPGPLSHPPLFMVTAGHWASFADDGAFMAPGDFALTDSFDGTLESVSVEFL